MPSPVKVTDASNPLAIVGSGERFLDRDSRGRLWLQLADGHDDLRHWYSKNEGYTWSYAGSDSSIDDLHISAPHGFHIDAEGYGHALGRHKNTYLRYARGRPGSHGVTWDWKKLDWQSSTEAIALESGFSMVSFRVGNGWKVWILNGTTLRDQAGNYTNTLRLTRIDVSSSGGLSVGDKWVIRTATGGSFPCGALTFQHTGDGKTSTATPHVYVVSGVNTPNTANQRQDPLQLVKMTYESGSWTQGSPVTLDSSTDTTGRTVSVGYDGARVVAAYGTRNRSTGTSSAAIKTVEYVDAGGAVTVRTPPTFAGGYPLGSSMAIDPISDDLFLVAYGETNDDPVWTRFSRTSGTWGAWTSVAAASMGGVSGRASLKTYVSSSAIDLVYETGTSRPYTIVYIKLTSINRAPSPPSLQTPAASSVTDLATYGAVFSWVFNDPDPGDQQSAWQMRRKTTAPGAVYAYFNNASGTWQSTAVWNTGPTTAASFGPGAWANGVIWQWSVNTQDAGGVASGFAPDSLVTASAAPVVTVLSPLAAYTEDSSPIVSWAYASANPQRTYRLRLFDLATYSLPGFDPASSAPVWDSGESASVQARSVRIGVSLLNGGTYRAFMQVSDSLGIYSQWAYGEFVLILTPAPAPLLEAVTETNYVTGLKRVRLTMQGSTNLLSASQAYDHTNSTTDWEADGNATWQMATVGSATVAGRSLQLTAVGGGDMAVVSSAGVAPVDTTGAPPVTPRDFAASPLQTYTAVGSFTASGAPRLCRLTLRFYAPTDALLMTVPGNAVADVGGFPTEVSVTGVAPLGADRVRLLVEVLGATAGDVHYVDQLDLHPGTVADFTPGGLVPAQTFTVTRTVNGVSSLVRTASSAVPEPSQRLITFDREMPFGTDVSYTAQAVTVLTSGQALASDPSGAAVVQVDSEVWAVRDPLTTDAEARALVIAYEGEILELQSVYRTTGRSLPLVETEGVQGEDGTKLSIFVDGVADRQNLVALIRETAALVLQSPMGTLRYVRFMERKNTAMGASGMQWDLTYVEVAVP